MGKRNCLISEVLLLYRLRIPDRLSVAIRLCCCASQAIHNAPFAEVVDHFTDLFNNLNLMWLTSSFFGQKKYMERLFESISNSIADRVSDTLSIPEIFK